MYYFLIFALISVLLLIYSYYRHSASVSVNPGRTVLTVLVVLFTAAIIINPGESFNAAIQGLNTWFNIVFPSLLPFFIGSDLLINLRMVDFLGRLLEPVMRPLFNVPGCGSFPFVMSITSGYPVGSKIVAELYNKKMCNRVEAQRLLSFCSTSGPLFMLGAVGVGMLNSREGGVIIALSHYLGAITLGLAFRYYKHREGRQNTALTNYRKWPFRMDNSMRNDNRPLGALLSEAVKNSVNSLLTIGGFIVLFSVVINLLMMLGITGFISHGILFLLSPFGIDKSLSSPIAGGLFEITIGSKLISSTQALLQQKIIAAAGIIGWSGFSIHAQVASMISTTDLNMKTYMVSKMFHGILSSIYSYAMIKLIKTPGILGSIEAFLYNGAVPRQPEAGWFSTLTWGFGKFIDSVMLLFVFAFLCSVISRYSVVKRRSRRSAL